jgi:hypothetical protein
MDFRQDKNARSLGREERTFHCVSSNPLPENVHCLVCDVKMLLRVRSRAGRILDLPESLALSKLGKSQQRSVVSREITGIQDLYARVMVAVERRYVARTPSCDRVCRVGKPDPEVVGLDWDWTGVQDEGFITKDPSHV